MSKWISIEDQLPVHGEHVLVWVAAGYPYIARYNSASCMFVCDEYIQCIKVTHWMLLPEAPTK